MTVQNLGMLGGRRQLMKPSERLDALRPSLEREADEAEAMRPGTMLDQLVRAEAAVREDPGHAMFSEGETFTDFHFGTDIPTGLPREVQSSDGMYAPEPSPQDRRANLFIVGLFIALGVVVLLAWANAA